MDDRLFLLDLRLDVGPLYWAIQQHPELWNRQTARTEHELSPHRDMDDIWIRQAPTYDRAVRETPYHSTWSPAAEILPVRPCVQHVMFATGGVELGDIFITRVPPGQQCHPHIDDSWHARYYQKFGLQLTSAPGQKFCVEELEIEPMPGQVFSFNNQHTHWVTNPTSFERVTMIICVKV